MEGGTLHVDGKGHAFIDDLVFSDFVLAGARTNTINTGGDYTLPYDISGAGGLVKTGGGTLTLSGVNTYSGGTDFAAGRLHAARNSALGTGPLTFTGGGVLLVDSGLTLNNAIVLAQEGTVEVRNGNAMLSGAVSGPSGLTKQGAGRLILAGANTYAGMTTVRDGTLALNSPGTISPRLTIHGGAAFDAPSGATPALDQLDVRGANAVYTGNLNAQNAALNFYVPPAMTAGGTMLRVSGTADITGGTVNVGIDGASSPLQPGDSVILVDAGTLAGAPLNTTANGQGMHGVTLLYDFDILADTGDNKLLATVADPAGGNNSNSNNSNGNTGGVRLNPRTKALSEGFISGAALINMGADTLAGQGIAGAVSAAKMGTAREGFGLAGFSAIGGGRSRYNTGSHVDVSGFSLLAGLSAGRDLAPGRLTLGAFFEYGRGDYDTYNSFSNAASVEGNGETDYTGGGVLGRFDFTDTGPGRFYAETSGRLGRVRSDYTSSLYDGWGRRAEYETEGMYYGMHLGAGYVWNIPGLEDRGTLDLYGKYFWTRQEGDSVRLSTGDRVRFQDVDSHRLRLGGRFAYALNGFLSSYVGAAFERDFDGKARAATGGHSIEAPQLGGSTGMGELGITVRPVDTIPFTLDLGVQGYTGKREGVTGSLQVKFEF
jgi:autotransporter-associated beta strand protein